MNKGGHLDELMTKQSHSIRNTDMEARWNDQKAKNGMLESNGT